jgi:hypothetical protein
MIATKSDSGEGGLKPAAWLEGVLQMYGMGKEMWEGEDPDEYVRHLRESWD